MRILIKSRCEVDANLFCPFLSGPKRKSIRRRKCEKKKDEILEGWCQKYGKNASETCDENLVLSLAANIFLYLMFYGMNMRANVAHSQQVSLSHYKSTRGWPMLAQEGRIFVALLR